MTSGAPTPLRRRAVLLAAVAASLGGCAGAAPPPGPPLVNPFDAAALRARKGRPSRGGATCAAASPPAADLIVPNFYTDPPVYSRVDPARLAARDAAVAPVNALARTVTQAADAWAASRPADGRLAACAAAALDAAARARSMLGRVDSQGGFERKWAWCGLALAHLKLAQAPEYDQAAQARVRAYLAEGFAALRGPYDRPPSGAPSSQMNNHMTWAGLAAMAMGLAADDRAAWDWGLSRMDRTLAQVDVDGFLPQEVLRGSKAWHYHIFTMGPLAMGAFLARANGADFADARDGAFWRVARLTLGAYSDPARFVARTGRAQDVWGERPSVGWLEILAGEFGVAEALVHLQGRRPQRDPWLGGDLTFWFARDA